MPLLRLDHVSGGNAARIVTLNELHPCTGYSAISDRTASRMYSVVTWREWNVFLVPVSSTLCKKATRRAEAAASAG
jgi:hypothetical protein